MSRWINTPSSSCVRTTSRCTPFVNSRTKSTPILRYARRNPVWKSSLSGRPILLRRFSRTGMDFVKMSTCFPIAKSGLQWRDRRTFALASSAKLLLVAAYRIDFGISSARFLRSSARSKRWVREASTLRAVLTADSCSALRNWLWPIAIACRSVSRRFSRS